MGRGNAYAAAGAEDALNKARRGKGKPSRAGSDRMTAAGRARCDEGMGIDSRDEGFPFPRKKPSAKG